MIVVRADAAADIHPDVLERLNRLKGIEWVGVFGPAFDVQNAAYEGGVKTPARLVVSDDLTQLGIHAPSGVDGSIAYGSETALDNLGFLQGAGQVAAVDDQRGFSVAGKVEMPDFLRFLDPVLFVPTAPDRRTAVSLIVMMAEAPNAVAALANAAKGVLAVDDSTGVTVETSEELATLRAMISGQLGGFGRTLSLGIFTLTGMLAAAVLSATIVLRRKEFGRRRALGASQQFVCVLLLTQVGLLSFVGAFIGTIASATILALLGDPLPPLDYLMSVTLIAGFVGMIAGVIPAVAASRRAPILELRVP